jgi:hypothetical protein
MTEFFLTDDDGYSHLGLAQTRLLRSAAGNSSRRVRSNRLSSLRAASKGSPNAH